MISLLLSILFTITLFILFKEFSFRDINNHQAITFNYLTAAILASVINMKNIYLNDIFHAEWLFYTICLGIFFIIMFNIMAITTNKYGISIASTASKMSLIIPVLVSLLIYNISISISEIIGIIIAIIAVYLTFKKDRVNNNITLAVVLFFGAGILDLSIELIRSNYLTNNKSFNQFIIVVFITAFFIGLIKIIFDKKKIRAKNIIAGIALGIPNYFSIFFVLKALEKLGSVYVFPILNIGVVLISAIISWFFYKEKMSRINWFGVFLACLSILIIM